MNGKTTDTEAAAGVILAGGLSRRMGGGDKGLLPLGDRPLLAHVAERAAPQVSRLLLSANGDPARFAFLGLEVAADVVEGGQGPLAGLLTALEWAARLNSPPIWLASFPCDAPFIPRDLVGRLIRAAVAAGAAAATARTGGRDHPTCGVWKLTLAVDLRRAMLDDDLRKMGIWRQRSGAIDVEFADHPFDPFINVNSPEDLAIAEKIRTGFSHFPA